MINLKQKMGAMYVTNSDADITQNNLIDSLK